MNNFDLRKYLAENKLLKENEEQGYTLYTTNVEYDNGKTGYMYQLVNSEDREENEIGFDQLYFDDEDNRLEMGVDFKDFDQGSYQEGEYTADEAMKMYKSLAENNTKKKKITWDIDRFDDAADVSEAADDFLPEVKRLIQLEIGDEIDDDELEDYIEVTNNYYYNIARKNSKGSNPKDISITAKAFADNVIENWKEDNE